MNSNNEYLTKDLYEAAFLYASDLTLVRLEKQPHCFFFVFLDLEKAKKLKDTYWSRAGTVRPKIYADAVRSLKQRLFLDSEQYRS